MSSDSRSNRCFRFSTMLANLGSRIRRMLSRQVESSSSEESITEELISEEDSDDFQTVIAEIEEASEMDVELQQGIETNHSPSPSLNKEEESNSKPPIERDEKEQESVQPEKTQADPSDDKSAESLNKDKIKCTNILCRVRISRQNKSEYNKLSKLRRKLELNSYVTFQHHQHTQTDDPLNIINIAKEIESLNNTPLPTSGIEGETSTENINKELNENETGVFQQDTESASKFGHQSETPEDTELASKSGHQSVASENIELASKSGHQSEAPENMELESKSGHQSEKPEDSEMKTSSEEFPPLPFSPHDVGSNVILDIILPVYLYSKIYLLCKEYFSTSKKNTYCVINLDDRVPYHQLYTIIKHIYAQLSNASKPSKFRRDKAVQTGAEAWNRSTRQMAEYLLSHNPSTFTFDEETAARVLKFIGTIYNIDFSLTDFFNCHDISEFADSGIPKKFQEHIPNLRLDFFKTLREHGKINEWVKVSRFNTVNFKSAVRQHLQRQIDILVGSCLYWYKEYNLQASDLDLSGFLSEYLTTYEAYVVTIRHSREIFASKLKNFRVTSMGDRDSCKSKPFQTEVRDESEETKQETIESSIEDTDSVVTASSCGSVDEIEQELEALEKEMRGNKWGCFYLFEQTDGIFDRGTEYWIDGQAAVNKSRKGARGDYIDRPKKKKTRGIPNKHLQNEGTLLDQNETNNLDDCKPAERINETKPEPETEENKIVLDPLFPCEIEESNVDTRHLKNAPAKVITGKKDDYEYLGVTYETSDKKPNKQRQNRHRKQQRANRQKTLQFGLNTNNCADDEYDSSSEEENYEFVQSRITYRENPL